MSPLILRPEVSALVGLSRTSIYRMIREGSFPEPVQVGKRRIAWRQSDLNAWLESRPTGTRSTGTRPTPATKARAGA